MDMTGRDGFVPEEAMKLFLGAGRIIIIPHADPDADALISASVMQRLLASAGRESCVCIIGTPDKEDVEAMGRYGLPLPQRIIGEEDIKDGDSLVLVDWSGYSGRDDQVVACFDHHPTARSFRYPVYENRASSSCAKLIYDLLVAGRADPLRDDESLSRMERDVLYSVSLDTNGTKSSKFVPDDLTWMRIIEEKLGEKHADVIRAGYRLTELAGDADLDVLHGLRRYSLPSGRSGAIGYIVVEGHDPAENPGYADAVKRALRSDDALSHLWFIITDMEQEKTWIVKCRKDAAGRCSHAGTEQHAGILSRSKDVYPMLEAADAEGQEGATE